MRNRNVDAIGLKSSIGFLAAALSFAAMARTQAFPPLPDSQFADAESSTNVAFNAVRSDARDFRVEMDFDGSESNCVQIAFGRDADGDGDLAARETALVVGWRAGRYFVEGACGGGRTCEEAAPAFAGRRHLLLAVSLDAEFRPRSAAATNETGACFAGLSAPPPPWLYDADWNLAKATRRGPAASAEILSLDCRYRTFHFEVR